MVPMTPLVLEEPITYGRYLLSLAQPGLGLHLGVVIINLVYGFGLFCRTPIPDSPPKPTEGRVGLMVTSIFCNQRLQLLVMATVGSYWDQKKSVIDYIFFVSLLGKIAVDIAEQVDDDEYDWERVDSVQDYTIEWLRKLDLSRWTAASPVRAKHHIHAHDTILLIGLTATTTCNLIGMIWSAHQEKRETFWNLELPLILVHMFVCHLLLHRPDFVSPRKWEEVVT